MSNEDMRLAIVGLRDTVSTMSTGLVNMLEIVEHGVKANVQLAVAVSRQNESLAELAMHQRIQTQLLTRLVEAAQSASPMADGSPASPIPPPPPTNPRRRRAEEPPAPEAPCNKINKVAADRLAQMTARGDK